MSQVINDKSSLQKERPEIRHPNQETTHTSTNLQSCQRKLNEPEFLLPIHSRQTTSLRKEANGITCKNSTMVKWASSSHLMFNIRNRPEKFVHPMKEVSKIKWNQITYDPSNQKFSVFLKLPGKTPKKTFRVRAIWIVESFIFNKFVTWIRKSRRFHWWVKFFNRIFHY